MGVSFVVHGSVEVEGDKARLSLALSDPKGVSWSQKQETTLRGAFADAERTAADIARAMGATPAPASNAPQRPEALELYLKGKTLLEGWDVDRNYAGAEASLEEATRLDPNFAEAYALLALARWTDYKETQRAALVQQAIDAADRAVALAPAQPEGHLARGVVLLGRGQSVEAAQSFERAQRLAPGDDAVCRQIAKAYAALRRVADAERMYQRAIDLRPLYWASYNYKGVFYLERAQWGKAKEMFRKVIELRPESDIGYSNLAAAHLSAGEIKEAEPVLQAALRIQPTAAAHNNLGFVYYALGRYEEAVREYEEAIKMAPSFRRWASLGDSHRQLGRKKEAGDAYARAIELEQELLRVNASDAKTRAVLAMNMAAIGRCEEARQEAGKALSEAEDDAYVHYYSANAYALCGSRQEAIRQAALAIKGGLVDDIHTNPDLRPLLSEPPLRELLAR
jgi:tetratricopeptide (TPR) repeat protein